MKKVLLLFVSAIILFGCFSGCNTSETVEIPVDIENLQKKLEEAELFTDTLERITKESVLSSVLFLTADNIEVSMLYMGSGYTGEEYALFKCVSAEAAKELVEELKARVDSQKAIYRDYAPDAIPRLNNAIIKQLRGYVIYVVADRYPEALKIVEEYLN